MKKVWMFLIGLALVACNNSASETESQNEAVNGRIAELKEEVIAIHDTAMIKMPRAGQMMRRLKEQWQSSADSLPYQQAYRQLAAANDDMMQWMRSFELPQEGEASERELEEYLLQEKRAIQAVNANLSKALEEGAFLLANSGEEMVDEGMDHSDHDDHHDHEGHQH